MSDDDNEPNVIVPFRHQKQMLAAIKQYSAIEYFFLIGGYGCVTGDTMLTTPSGDIRIDEFQGGEVLSFDQSEKRVEWATARPPRRFKQKRIFEIKLSDGRTLKCTRAHRVFLEGQGWVKVSDLLGQEVRKWLLVFDDEPVFVEIESIRPCGKSEYYDLSIPSNNCYFANGILSHNCGKSFTDVLIILWLASVYWQHPVKVGIGGTTIALLRKTLIADLEQILISSGSVYRFDHTQNTIQIGRMLFVLVPTEQPQLIYAHNFSIFLCDELDELRQDVAMEAVKAIQERVRVPLPEVPGGRAKVKFKDIDGNEQEGVMPFSVFSTTAQGYRGTYQVIEGLKEKNQGYVKVRGLTKDNTKNSPAYIKRLYAIYDENERLAFLEGHFVNLRTGRVYPDYDEAICQVPAMTVLPTDKIYIGQDLNTGFSKACVIIKREKVLYIVAEFSFAAIGDAPKIIRNAYPQNEIFWFPDASGKEIMTGYLAEIRQANIQLRTATVNPNVMDRIFLVNKMFKLGKLKTTRGLKGIPMALKTRQFNDVGDPEKGKGENAPDHFCFVGSTLIATEHGPKPIKDISVGEYVLTRQGYKKVTASDMTGIREVKKYNIGGSFLISTHDHPVWTKKGFTPIDHLTQSDMIYEIDSQVEELCRLLKALSLTELFTGDILSPGEDQKEYITGLALSGLKKATAIFTEKSGNLSTATYLKVFMFIIRTMIREITRSKISNSYWGQNTYQCTGLSSSKRIQKLLWQILRRHELRQVNGTKAPKVEHGIRKMLKNILGRISWKIFRAISVAVYSSGKRGYQSFVQKNASRRIEENQVSITSQGHAHNAEETFKSTSTQRQDAVRDPAQNEIAQVYNLTVEYAHEYFANGILVSNCDSTEYDVYRIAAMDPDFADIWQVIQARSR